jgi:hypothetical protein
MINYFLKVVVFNDGNLRCEGLKTPALLMIGDKKFSMEKLKEKINEI